MFLSLEEPGGDKHVSLFARNLPGEQNYDPMRAYTRCGSQRARFDATVQIVNKLLGSVLPKPQHQAFGILFNQFTWQGTSGWEYWTNDLLLVLRHALAVAAELGEPLHLHEDVLLKVLDDAERAGIKFDWLQAKPQEKLNEGDCMPFVNKQLERGEYHVLSNVVIPSALAIPACPE